MSRYALEWEEDDNLIHPLQAMDEYVFKTDLAYILFNSGLGVCDFYTYNLVVFARQIKSMEIRISYGDYKADILWHNMLTSVQSFAFRNREIYEQLVQIQLRTNHSTQKNRRMDNLVNFHFRSYLSYCLLEEVLLFDDIAFLALSLVNAGKMERADLERMFRTIRKSFKNIAKMPQRLSEFQLLRSQLDMPMLVTLANQQMPKITLPKTRLSQEDRHPKAPKLINYAGLD